MILSLIIKKGTTKQLFADTYSRPPPPSKNTTTTQQGAKTHVWLSTAKEAGDVTGRFYIDPGVEYPSSSVTREQLVAGGDWFLVTGREPLAPQLRLPDVLFDWRTEANATSLWEQSLDMIKPFRV